MSNKLIKIVVIAVVLIALIVITIGLLWNRQQLPTAVNINTTHQPTLGNVNAKVHIVVFEDLKCVNCARFHDQISQIIKPRYIDTGKAKYTVINLAFIEGSMPAANAALCLYQQNPRYFFDFVDTVYNNQPPETENWATIPTLMALASQIKGINQDQLASCLVLSPYTDTILHNLKIAQQTMSPIATPAVYVNGVPVQPLTIEQLEKLIKHFS